MSLSGERLVGFPEQATRITKRDGEGKEKNIYYIVAKSDLVIKHT